MSENIEKLLEKTGALLNGHFKLTSGRHSDRYIEKIKLIHEPKYVEIICKQLAEKLKDLDIDIVVGPAMGGITLAYSVAKHLDKKFVFSQRRDGKMIIRSGFPIEKGDKAVIIEDIVTTGGSVREVIECLEEREIDLQAVGLIVDRTGGEIDFGVRTESLLEMKVESWEPQDCPLCKKNVEFNTPGSSGKK